MMKKRELKRAVPTITEKVLIQHLKQLEADGLLVRESKPVVPPYVIYRLTASGEGLQPVIQAMPAWTLKEKAGGFLENAQ